MVTKNNPSAARGGRSRSRTDEDDDDCKPPAVPRSPPTTTTISRTVVASTSFLTRESVAYAVEPPPLVGSSAAASRDAVAHPPQPIGEWHRVSNQGAAAHISSASTTGKKQWLSNKTDLDEDNKKKPSLPSRATAGRDTTAASFQKNSNELLSEKRQMADRKGQYRNYDGPAVTPGVVAVGGPAMATRNASAPGKPSRASSQVDEGCSPLVEVARKRPASCSPVLLKQPYRRASLSNEGQDYVTLPGAVAVPGLFSPRCQSGFEDDSSKLTEEQEDKDELPSPLTSGSASSYRREENVTPVTTSAAQLTKSTPAVSGAIEVIANVVPDDEDIEAQVQARMDKERNEIAAQVEERLMHGAVHADVMSEGEILRESNYQGSRRIKLIILGLLVVIVAVVVAVVVAMTMGGDESSSSDPFPTVSPTTSAPTPSPTPVPKCTLCADGAIPSDLDSMPFELGGDGVTCADFMERQVLLDLPDDACVQGQAIGWLFCDCSTLPPAPEDATCTQCLDGSDPVAAEGSSLEFCTDWNTFLAHVGSSPFFECAALRSDSCRCDSDPTQMEFLTNLFLPISGEALLQEGTPQNDALYWLAVQDPANLTAATSSTTELTQRYALAVLFFATDGTFWDNDYGFQSRNNVCDWNDDAEENGVFCNSNFIVEKIELDSNSLDGTLPNELTVLTGLKRIELPSNNLVGSIPQTMWKLSLLERFDVDFNSMTGSIMGLFDILSLRQLWLDENNFSGPLPTTLDSELGLESFTCIECSLNGPLPENFFLLSNLWFVNLNTNSFGGPLPPFGANSRLRQLWLRENQLTGTLPSTVGTLSRLEYMDLHNNFLDGTISPTFGRLQSLIGVDLSDNLFLGTIPPLTGDQITDVFLHGNSLNGTLETFFGLSSKAMARISVDQNQLTGPVPDTIGGYSQLELLDMAQNKLSGQFPTVIGKLRALEYLNLNFNRFTGTIPSELGLCTQLERLYFGVSDLSGTVPGELGNLVKLMSLGFARAGLEGSFPEGAAALPELEFLAVQGNNFNNDFEDTFCTREDPIDMLWASCLVETVVCPCCSNCCNEFGFSCVSQ